MIKPKTQAQMRAVIRKVKSCTRGRKHEWAFSVEDPATGVVWSSIPATLPTRKAARTGARDVIKTLSEVRT
jgi:aminoglycoside phosphotransferase (APT) family kinase protein